MMTVATSSRKRFSDQTPMTTSHPKKAKTASKRGLRGRED